MQRIRLLGIVVAPALALAGCAPSFDSIRDRAMIASGEVLVLTGDAGEQVLVAPGLQGRILTSRVGRISSAAFVSLADLERGARPSPFNNYGGQDRFWIGPEAGPDGFYFDPGAPAEREGWRVPEPLNTGAMEVDKQSLSPRHAALSRDLRLTNGRGVVFDIGVRREVGVISAGKLNEELGVVKPDGVELVGAYSLNAIVNRGTQRWRREDGLPCVWILGQFMAGRRTVIIAPFRRGDAAALGAPFNDEYFGKSSVLYPERIAVLDGAVLMRADAGRETKLGVGPKRATGFAGAYDPDRRLLIIVKFDVRPADPLYASFSWATDEAKRFEGDVLQCYNAGGTPAGEPHPTHPFFELESVSPCRELAAGEEMVHRHATFFFTGPEADLDAIAARVLGVRLEAVRRAFP